MYGYVLYVEERLQDGTERCAYVVQTIEEALREVNRQHPYTESHNISFRLFELGKEIPLEQETVEEPQPPITKTQYKVRKK